MKDKTNMKDSMPKKMGKQGSCQTHPGANNMKKGMGK